MKTSWVYVDTRRMGAMSEMLDGLFHIVPRESTKMHCLRLECWCEPRVIWSPGAETCIVSHWRFERPNGTQQTDTAAVHPA